jgi:hypothetical protein
MKQTKRRGLPSNLFHEVRAEGSSLRSLRCCALGGGAERLCHRSPRASAHPLFSTQRRACLSSPRLSTSAQARGLQTPQLPWAAALHYFGESNVSLFDYWFSSPWSSEAGILTIKQREAARRAAVTGVPYSEDLCSHYEARLIARHKAYGQFIKAGGREN